MKRNLQPYRLLIVDDFAQFRLALKKMLERKDAAHIDQVGNAPDAIKACRDTRYDIIFCDYHLGDGQDGQQLLEELHERALLARRCLFVMVTAEMMEAQVIGALEYQPDAYLGKPFTFEQLCLRLDRLITRNELLGDVYLALDGGEIERALALCDEVVARTPAVRYTGARIKSELLEQQQEFAAARETYQQVVAEQPLLWAELGLGRVLFAEGHTADALAHFERLRGLHPRQISVLDWIARCQLALGDVAASEQALIEATALSPKSVARQARLGEIAERLDHHDVARKAWARTINEGRHSCLVGGDNYRHFFDNAGKMLDGLDGRDRSRALAEIENAAAEMETRLRHQPADLAVNHGALAGLFRDAGRGELSDRHFDKLAQALDDPACRLSDDGLAYIEQRVGRPADGAGEDGPRARIRDRLQQMERDAGDRRRKDDVARDINQQGLDLFEQKNPRAALEKFREALASMPDNPTYLLNAAQMVLLHRELRDEAGLVREARDWMRRVSLAHDDDRMPLYRMLRGRLPHG